MLKELKRQKRIHGLSEDISLREKELLEKGVPIQKIIGFINFDDLQINVNHNVLIPRYETQEVVEKALEYINNKSKVLDLCSGSGYIGLTVKHKTGANVTLADIDEEAISQSKENAKFNDLDVKIIKSDLFENIEGKFDVIISNPPYVPSENKLDKSVLDHEPHIALFAGRDGNDIYRKIIAKFKNYLNEGGKLILEISPDNVEYIKEQGFEIFKDINKKERIAIFSL